MKPHQVRAQHKRPAKSKQAQNRSTRVESQKANPNNGAAIPDAMRIVTDHCLAALPKRGEGRKNILQALHVMMTDAHPDKAAVMQELKAIHEAECPTTPVVLTDRDLDTIYDLSRRVEDNVTKSRGFHYLIVTYMEHLATRTTQGSEPTGAEACGIMQIGQDIDGENESIHTALIDTYAALTEDRRAKRLAAIQMRKEFGKGN